MVSRLRDRCANIRKIPGKAEQVPSGELGLVGLPLILLRRTNFIFYLINMDETKNWKVITTDEAGEPTLKYDPHRDETVNVITGEVVQGH